MTEETVVTTPGKRPPGRPKGAKTKRREIGGHRPRRHGDGLTLDLVIPVDPLPDVPYHARRVEVHRLTPEQAETLARIFAALNREHATLANGKHVDAPRDVVRWLLDEVGKHLA